MMLIRLAFLLLTISAYTQSVSTLMGARGNGMGYITATLADGFSMLNNVAGLATFTQPLGAAAYNLAATLPGANRAAFTVGVPVKPGVAGFSLFRFGDNVYNESMVSAGFSNQFGLAALGVKVNYIQYQAEGFGTKGVFTIGMGGIAKLTRQISVGAYITNFNRPEISADGDKVPALLTASLAFTPTENVLLAAEVQKDLDYETTWKAGLEYAFHRKFFARTGFNLKPNASFFGLGFKTGVFNFDYAVQYSTVLQFSHQASATYKFGKP
ncbi:MAG: hypothetical protein HRU69_13685 [Flammeovirgaceae bacterium]|nr:MAG: hypothetical protein HRU69_13685 [Flammeovirgaceae bacterium]